MQSAVMALVELNKLPCAYLFSEYLDRIAKTVSDERLRQSVMTLVSRLLGEEPTQQQPSFFDMMMQALVQHMALPPEKQEAIQEKASPTEHILAVCAKYLNPEDLMMVVSIIQNLNTEGDNPEEVMGRVKDMQQAMDNLATKMSESLGMMLVGMVVLLLLPRLLVSLIQQSRSNSLVMADLFEKVLTRVRKSNEWEEYWKARRETLQAVNDSMSWERMMKEERDKERQELGQVPGALFAKWTTAPDEFGEALLKAHLSDDELRHFIFHLTTLYKIARELDPMTKYGEEQLVLDETQQVGNAVLEAAMKLQDLTTQAWFPQYEAMWQALIQNENIFARLKVTRNSPHNDLFTARFFCHLVGGMKKSAVFGIHSDMDLAKKLVDEMSVDTYRKNIQEGMHGEDEKLKNIFDAILQKHKNLAHPKNNCTIS